MNGSRNKAKRVKKKINFKQVEKHSSCIGELSLCTVEEIMRMARYYSGKQLFTATYDDMFYTVQQFVRITHIPRGKLSKLVHLVTGLSMEFETDEECSLFYAIYVAKELELKPLGYDDTNADLKFKPYTLQRVD